MSLLTLPGELTAHARDNLSFNDLKSHLSFYHATRNVLTIYDERFWKRLCFANGVGRVEEKASWKESVEVVEGYRDEAQCEHEACGEACRFGQAYNTTPVSDLSTLKEPLLLNPIFSQLRLNWRSEDLASNAQIHTPEKDTLLSDHLSSFAFATSPPVSCLYITLPNIPLSSAFEPLRISCPDGVLVRDVILSMHKWMQTPLTDAQRQGILDTMRIADPESFSKLEETTDEDTLAWFWTRRLHSRRDLVYGRFAGLSLGGHTASDVIVQFEEDDRVVEQPVETPREEKRVAWLSQRLETLTARTAPATVAV